MNSKKPYAVELLRNFRNDQYAFGLGCMDRLGELVASQGRRASVVISGLGKSWSAEMHAAVRASLEAAHMSPAGDWIQGARPNTPRDDVFRIADQLADQQPDVVLSVGGGSGIDATKCALAYWTLRDYCDDLDKYFGVNTVSQMLNATHRTLPPLVVSQLASASASHLTKYSCVTDFTTHQKMIIVDPAIVPARSHFDYAMTFSMSREFTMDGALDGVAHCLEVWMGIDGALQSTVEPIALTGIDLIVNHLPTALADPTNPDAREALGLGTDLGGYAIMVGGTNGAHLTSFSLVDILPHGRACALMNPYFAVLFAPAIENKLRAVGEIYRAADYISVDLQGLHGYDLGRAVAEGMIALSHHIGFPTTLAEVDGFTDEHISRALTAAKNPALASKLQNMPTPLTAEMVDDTLGPVLQAAQTGDFSLITAR